MKENVKTATQYALEYLDQSEELRDFYKNATIYRSRKSFKRKKDILHVDISEDSDLTRFINELEKPTPFQRLTGDNFCKEYQTEGIVEGLYAIFDESYADRVMIHPDEKQYFGPSMEGIASMEIIDRMEAEGNIHWDTLFTAEDYLWDEVFDKREHELWSNWLDQRPRNHR